MAMFRLAVVLALLSPLAAQNSSNASGLDLGNETGAPPPRNESVGNETKPEAPKPKDNETAVSNETRGNETKPEVPKGNETIGNETRGNETKPEKPKPKGNETVGNETRGNETEPEKPKPKGNETKPEGNETKPEKPKPKGNETELEKPKPKGNETKPEGNESKPEKPKPKGNETKPEGNESKPEKPKGNETKPEKPEGNETKPKGNESKPEKPKGNESKPEKPKEEAPMNGTKGDKDGGKEKLPPRAEKPSTASQKEAASALKGCGSNATCREEAKAQFAKSNGGKDAKVTNAFFKQAEAAAAKDAAKDAAKGCVAKDLSKEQKATCFEASKAGLAAAVDALLGDASAEVKAKKKKEMAKDAARDVLGDSFGACMAAAGAKRSTCLGELSELQGSAGLEGEDAKSIVDRHFQEKIREAASECTEKACRKAGKAAAVAAGMLEREYAGIKSLGEIKSAATIYSNCVLAGSDENTCLGLARDEFVQVSGAREEDFTDEISARVQRMGNALSTGTPVVMVRLKKMGASVIVGAAACDAALQEWFRAAVFERSKKNESRVEEAVAKACRVVDGEVEYRCSVDVNVTDEEISALSEQTVGSFEGETLGARRLGEFLGRRLATVTEVYASQDVSECAETDAGCLSGEPSTTPTSAPTAGPTDAPSSATAGPTVGPTAGPTSAPTDAPTSGPTDAPTSGSTAAPTSAPEAPVSGAAAHGLGALALMAFVLLQ